MQKANGNNEESEGKEQIKKQIQRMPEKDFDL